MLFAGDIPRTVVAITVWAYWVGVGVMVVRNRWRFGRPAGGVPRTALERWIWAAWLPAIMLWQIVPTLSATASHPLLAVPAVAVDNRVLVTVRWLAACLAIAALALTIPCWLRMGKDWSMAIVPGKRRRLITSGMFTYVRHPIYALSILLMIATMVVVSAPIMLAVGCVHIVMLVGKAANEERHLRGTHGQKYADYCVRTGRFVPRLIRTASIRD
jgi:protein-S-isoprenylcysteine O-methyltransferase Ste14